MLYRKGTMNPISILHLADAHLGIRPVLLGAGARARAHALFRTFSRTLARAKEDKRDVLLIAGDFLEAAQITPQELSEVQEMLGACPFPVFISPGNHDYHAPDGPYASKDWPENVHIFSGAVKRVDVESVPLSVYGTGFTGTLQRTSLLTGMDWEKEKKETEGRVRVLLTHGTWGVESVYHGIRPEHLPPDFFTYIALGHIHQRSELLSVGRSKVAYPGCPDGTGFDETGIKGVYVGTLLPMIADLSFAPTSSAIFQRVSVDISKATQTDEALDLIWAQVLREVSQDQFAPNDRFLRLLLEGDVASEDAIDLDLLQSKLDDRVQHAEIRDLRLPAVDWEKLAEEESLRGYFAEELRMRWQKADADGKKKIERAFRIGLDAFEGKAVPLADS